MYKLEIDLVPSLWGGKKKKKALSFVQEIWLSLAKYLLIRMHIAIPFLIPLVS